MSGRTGVLVLLVAGMTAACRDSPAAPTPARPAGPALPVPVAISIVGTGRLTAPGETAALDAVLHFSDGRVVGQLAGVSWTTADPGVATISPDGVVTAQGFGLGGVNAEHRIGALALRASLGIVVTPEGTFVNGGRVREPGGGSLENVVVREVTTAVRAVTDREGRYSLAGLTSGRLTVDLAGFEPVNHIARPWSTADDIPVQRILRVPAGGTLSFELTPNDVRYPLWDDEECQPCKKVRIVSPTAGVVDVEVTWNDVRPAIELWADGVRHGVTPARPSAVAATLAVGAGETIVYVGGPLRTSTYAGHVPVKIVVSPVR